MRDLRSDSGKDQALLMFLFVFGSFLFILYGDSLARAADLESGKAWRLISLVLFLDAAFAASVTAIVILPLLTWGFGFLAALGAKEIFELSAASSASWKPRLFVLLFLVPVHFVLSARGMENASALRDAMRARGLLSWKTSLFPYAVIWVGPAAALLIRHMLKL